MSKKILVTDTLFILPSHEKQLELAGYEVIRLAKSDASEDEMCEAIKGKAGYIIGGFEKVTDRVIDNADQLQAIMFVGTSWKWAIPGYERATRKGIAIGAALHLNAPAVAEFGLTMSLVLCRDVITLARGGVKNDRIGRSLSDMCVGVFGLGHVGTAYARMVKALGAKEVSYYSRTRKLPIEKELAITYRTKKELLKASDLVFVSLPIAAGDNFFSSEDISSMPKDAIIVSVSDSNQFDHDALYKRLSDGELKAAFTEEIKEKRYQSLPVDVWYTPTSAIGDNTMSTVNTVSDCCVKTLINLIETGKDKYRVN